MKEPKATKEQFKLTDMCNGNKESNLDSTMDATLNDTMENMEADYTLTKLLQRKMKTTRFRQLVRRRSQTAIHGRI